MQPLIDGIIIAMLVGVLVLLWRGMSEREELRLLRETVRLQLLSLDEQRETLVLLRHLVRQFQPRLARIQILVGGSMADPITLQIGDKKTATVQGFDQFGQPFPIDFSATPDTWSDDNAGAVTSTPASPANGTTALEAVAAGVANLSVTVGGFSDSIQLTVAQATPVLSSVKISVA